MGFMSFVPETLVLGFSLDSTSPASAKSVTAVAIMGISLVLPATAWAAGVAIAKTRSTLSPTNLSAMVERLFVSPWPF